MYTCVTTHLSRGVLNLLEMEAIPVCGEAVPGKYVAAVGSSLLALQDLCGKSGEF